jgi:hypothetical protein
MIVNRMLAAPAACAAEVTGPAIPPMDITIVMMDVSILFGVKVTLQVMRSRRSTHIMIIVTLGICNARYSFTAYQNERANVLCL